MAIKLRYPTILFRFPKWAKISAQSSENHRYSLVNKAIEWDRKNCKPLPMANHVEMSGLQSSVIFSYGVNKDGSVRRFIYGIFPKLRLYPNDTHSSLGYIFKAIKIGSNDAESADKITFDGILTMQSSYKQFTVVRAITAARNAKAVVEKITVTAKDAGAKFKIINPCPSAKVSKLFMHGDKPIAIKTVVYIGEKSYGNKLIEIELKKGESQTYYVAYSAGDDKINAKSEFDARREFLQSISNKLTITTPDPIINQMLAFTKLRASESIFDTKGGYMHAPGGGGFYAAMWTNDQCEYANPYFAYLGYDIAQKSAVNSFEWFGKYVKIDTSIVSSVIAEGDGVWHGAGDRGDNAMYVYGLTRYIMTNGDRDMAQKYLDKLVVATQFFINKINADGVVESDADELENRFESGKANLSTSCIAYDALISMGYLLQDLGQSEKAEKYRDIGAELRSNIDKYFSSQVEGFDTYRYCKEETALRSWVCLPLTVGIFDRAVGSIAAIMSDKLLKGNGILTRSGEKTYWDRSGLYALRGIFLAGQADKALELLSKYSAERLLGEHAPYPVEAYPEGNGAHLSAESALYQRIFTEGVLGYRPLGLNKFQIAPNLPSSWGKVEFKNIQLFCKAQDIIVNNSNGEYQVIVGGKEYIIPHGGKLELIQ